MRSLQFSHDGEATNQEAKELSATKKLSPATTKELGKDSLLVLEHEVEDLCFLSIRCGENQTFLFEDCLSSRAYPYALFQQDLFPSPREKGSLLLPTVG